MGFTITGGDTSWIGTLLLLIAIPAAIIVVVWLVSAGKQARDEVVQEDHDAGRDGPVA